MAWPRWVVCASGGGAGWETSTFRVGGQDVMFESLQDGLQAALKSLRGKGKLTEANMRDGLKLVEQLCTLLSKHPNKAPLFS